MCPKIMNVEVRLDGGWQALDLPEREVGQINGLNVHRTARSLQTSISPSRTKGARWTSSVVIWTRLALEPVAETGLSGMPEQRISVQ